MKLPVSQVVAAFFKVSNLVQQCYQLSRLALLRWVVECENGRQDRLAGKRVPTICSATATEEAERPIRSIRLTET